MTPSPLTDKMLAYQVVPGFDYNEAVDWALDLLLREHDTPSLCILAGLSKPVDQLEALGYLLASLRELGLRCDSGEAAWWRYARYLVGQLAAGQQVARTLGQLGDWCLHSEYESQFWSFLRLEDAWRDFDFGETFSYYWPEARPATIEQLVVAQAQQWLAEAAPGATNTAI